jgi:hypothetical protein
MVHACIYLGKDKKKNKNKICHLFIEKEVEKIAIED